MPDFKTGDEVRFKTVEELAAEGIGHSQLGTFPIWGPEHYTKRYRIAACRSDYLRLFDVITGQFQGTVSNDSYFMFKLLEPADQTLATPTYRTALDGRSTCDANWDKGLNLL